MWALQQRVAPYLFVLPFVVLFAVFMLYPLARSVVLSFQQTDSPRQATFIGLANYRFALSDPLFWRAVANTAAFTLLLVVLQVPLSLGLAVLLNSPRVWFRAAFRFAFFSSYLVGHVFVAILFALMLAPRHGLVNRAIGALLPRVGSELNWRDDPGLALPAIVVAALWLSVGYGMVYLLAALQAVDRDLYDAADVDGAGRWARFWHVTLPGVRHVLFFLVLVGTIGSLQLFELPYVFFQGPGPEYRGLTVVMYLYEAGFVRGELGYASAVGWVLVLLIAAVVAVQLRATRALRGDGR